MPAEDPQRLSTERRFHFRRRFRQGSEHAALRPSRGRGQVAEGLGRRRGLHHSEPRAGGGSGAPLLRARDAAVPVRRAAHGARQELHDRRRALPPAPAPRAARAASDGLRRVRPAGRERRDPRGPAPARRHRTRTSPRSASSSSAWAGRSTGRASSRRPSPSTTAGRSGSSCSCSSAAWPTRTRRRSTGARSTRPCWPTSRSSTATASAAGRPSRAACSRSGTSRSPTTPSGCSTTWRCWRTGPSACWRCSATGSGAPRARRCCSTSATWTSRCPSSRRGPTRCSARRSSCWRPSIR